jgi:hypothetical protein
LRDQECVERLKKRLARSVDIKWEKLAGRVKQDGRRFHWLAQKAHATGQLLSFRQQQRFF